MVRHRLTKCYNELYSTNDKTVCRCDWFKIFCSCLIWQLALNVLLDLIFYAFHILFSKSIYLRYKVELSADKFFQQPLIIQNRKKETLTSLDANHKNKTEYSDLCSSLRWTYINWSQTDILMIYANGRFKIVYETSRE
jgi:hypothetical protein